MVGHGGWLKYLEDKVEFSRSAAYKFMQAARESDGFQAFGSLEVSKVYLLLEAPEDERERLAEQAPDMTTRQLEEAVRTANAAKREAEEAKRRASDAEERARQAEARPPKVVEKVVEVVKPDPSLQRQIDELKQALAKKDRTIDEKQRDQERVQRMLSDANRELQRMRDEIDLDGRLNERIAEKEQQLKQLTEMHNRMSVQFDDDGADPNGGIKLLSVLQPVDDVVLKVLGDVRVLKRAGVGGWCEDDRVRELSNRLKQLAEFLDEIMAERSNRPIIADAREVR